MLPFAMLAWSWVKSGATFALEFLKGLNPWQLALLALGIFALVQHFQLVSARHERDWWHKQFTAEHAGRLADRQAYEKAQADAARDNKVQVQRVEQQYQRNSDDERQAYLRDLAQLRAQRVRQQNAAPSGAPGATGTPAPDASAPRIDEAGLCVPATSDVCEAGAEIELRLMHLQNLFVQQVTVDPNK